MTKPPTRNPSLGLFQTNDPNGYIYPILSVLNTTTLERIPYLEPTLVENSDKGKEHALAISKYPLFEGWAIDPWEGKINVELRLEENSNTTD